MGEKGAINDTTFLSKLVSCFGFEYMAEAKAKTASTPNPSTPQPITPNP
jgi:hypothetical protein